MAPSPMIHQWLDWGQLCVTDLVAVLHRQVWTRRYGVGEQLISQRPTICHVLEHHGTTTCTLSSDCDLRRVAGKETNIRLHPLQGEMLI